MDTEVPRAQVRLMALMVILMWWSYFEWIRPVMLPPRYEQRQVFPPGALDPNSTYQHLRWPRARYEPRADQSTGSPYPASELVDTACETAGRRHTAIASERLPILL
jgi:hypothetical protein